ncbi:DUF4097 family beta strand repeat-containing protein [Sinanaerobacter chloroacetimidivorans]|uniref:DUF4097 family beta strand repeat protein n=1 Tax=Sinanaerobacter chloroacetimidivorans TaxID=2818044 RepID=A0A8J7W4Y1_9FIRM|nr:DUF4097 family beta strand repeat-containing protein [Sinanaerobacter chloroacetimidivorans]MBR0599116.1 DUF4097 family beta strand repeat protein [Sinanaerobacter chloroacetimidivorans]
MNKAVKAVAIVGACMIAVGILLAGVGYITGGSQSIHIGRDGIQLSDRKGTISNGKMERFTDDLEAFHNIDADLGQYDVDLIPSDHYGLEYTYTGKKEDITYQVENDTLIIKEKDRVSVNIDVLDFSFSNADGYVMKIYYPKETKFEEVTIHCSAADLTYEKLAAEKLNLDLDFGRLDLHEVTADTISVEMNSGDCSLEQISGDKLHVANSFGKVTLKKGSFKTVEIDANSGDVVIQDTDAESADLNLDFGKLSAKNFKTKGLKSESNSGDVNLQGAFSGQTEVTCSMGKVSVDTDIPKDQYSYELNTDMGSVFLDGDKVSGVTSGTGGKTDHVIKIKANMGDIHLNFK